MITWGLGKPIKNRLSEFKAGRNLGRRLASLKFPSVRLLVRLQAVLDSGRGNYETDGGTCDWGPVGLNIEVVEE